MLNTKPTEKGQGFNPVVCCKQYNLLTEVETEKQILLFIWEEEKFYCLKFLLFVFFLMSLKYLKSHCRCYCHCPGTLCSASKSSACQTGPKYTVTFFALSWQARNVDLFRSWGFYTYRINDWSHVREDRVHVETEDRSRRRPGTKQNRQNAWTDWKCIFTLVCTFKRKDFHKEWQTCFVFIGPESDHWQMAMLVTH